jgi:hypothetical protein
MVEDRYHAIAEEHGQATAVIVFRVLRLLWNFKADRDPDMPERSPPSRARPSTRSSGRSSPTPRQGDFRNPGVLRRVEHVIDGIKVVDYRGDPGVFIGQFTSPTALVVDMDIGRPHHGRVNLPGARR